MATDTPQLGGFLGGMLAAQDRRQQELERNRSNAAYQSFIDTYGPGAGEPNALATLEATARLNQRQPLELQGLQIGNDAAQTGLDQSRQLFPETLQGARLDNAGRGLTNAKTQQTISQSDQAFPLEQQQRQGNIDSQGLQNQGMAATLDDNELARRKQAIGSGVRLLTAVRDSGGDIGAAFDRLVPTLKAMGLPDGEMQQVRSQIIADPTTLDSIAASLNDPALLKGRAAAAAAAGPPLSEAQKFYERALGREASKAEAAIFDRENANQTIITKAEDSAADIKSAVDTLLQPDTLDSAFGWGALGRNINASEYANAATAIDTLKSKIRINVIQAMKDASKTGATGFGQLSDTEGKIIENYLGALTPEQSPEQAKITLGKIKDRVDAITTRARTIAAADNENARKKAEELFKRIDGQAAMRGKAAPADEQPRSGPIPLPPELQNNPQVVDGTVIEDDQGRRYAVQGGQLVPQ